MDTSFLDLIRSPRVSEATQSVLLTRARDIGTTEDRPLLSDPLFATLIAISESLIPQGIGERIDLAAALFSKSSSGNGWRYAKMPKDRDALFGGLMALNDSSLQEFGNPFHSLESSDQIALLTRALNGEFDWSEASRSRLDGSKLDSSLWFEEVLSDLVEIYVSHPSTMSLMGFDGFAFLPEWQHIGLDTAEPWEPKAR